VVAFGNLPVVFRAAHRDAVLVAIQVGILRVNLLLTRNCWRRMAKAKPIGGRTAIAA
jgi:hypothetical protein